MSALQLATLRAPSRAAAGAVCLLITVGACGKSNGDPTCATPDDGLAVRYVGQAYGYGTIRVTFDEKLGAQVVYADMLGPDSMARVTLAGEGTCSEGLLRVRLGGGRDDASGLRMLGGGLIVVFDHEPMSTIVGFWDVRVIRDGMDDGPEGRLFRGMLETVEPSNDR